MLKTRLCDLLGIQHPLIAAPMGPNLSDVDLVATVSEAGAPGFCRRNSVHQKCFRDKLRELRRRTSKPFGVNLILHFPSEHLLEVCLAEGVPLISFFWGDPGALVERCHRAGAKVMLQIGSVEVARRAAAAGVDLIVAQGVEAGGHVAGAVGPWRSCRAWSTWWRRSGRRRRRHRRCPRRRCRLGARRRSGRARHALPGDAGGERASGLSRASPGGRGGRHGRRRRCSGRNGRTRPIEGCAPIL